MRSDIHGLDALLVPNAPKNLYLLHAVTSGEASYNDRGGITTYMKISDSLLPEFDHEMATTRKMLERVPEDKFGWTPHEKSMTMGKLACHVAGIPFFGTSVAKSDSMDFAKGEYEEVQASNRQQLLDGFDKTVAAARAGISGMSDEDMMKSWALQMGGNTLMSMPKVAVLRTVLMNHLVHHRGQLSVYLRMTNTPVPSIYGPSADEGQM